MPGYTRSQVIDQANRRTDKKGFKMLDLNAEFLTALQEFCQERRWPWRRLRAVFNTVAGTAEYDLSQNVAGQQNIAVERIPKKGVRLYVSSSDYCQLPPIFDEDEQEAALDDTTQDRPSAYFILPGTTNTMRLTATPDGVYGIRAWFWALPDTTPDAQAEAIPLVPGFLHHILVKKLEAQIFRYTLGEGSAKYQAAMGEYQSALQRAALNTDFAEGRNRDWTDQSGEAIRST